MQGCILNGSNNFFSVECSDGRLRTCSIKGKILKGAKEFYNPLCPGDIVSLEPSTLSQNSAQIISLEERKNSFARWNIKKRLPQLLCANLDFLALVTSPSNPPFRPRFIDRALAQAELNSLVPIIICNKSDLPFSEEFKKYTKIWKDIGYTVINISAKTGENIEELSSILENKLTALVGQSGVGKSSIINALDSSKNLRTGDICTKYNRGSHTTTQGTLLHLLLKNGNKANIIDTPGIRRFIIHDIDSKSLALYFKEFSDLVGTCTFGMSCTHEQEQGCKILDALKNGRISLERYKSWLKIKKEIESESWED
ncbi:MAG: ribosome small subunit-dependent GTPase A [Treponema sp.]|nr:ribosome small subunit-dependent GTPase A [Treponema sp.]